MQSRIGDKQTDVRVHTYRLQQLIHKVEPQMTVLQHYPASLVHELRQQSPRMHFLSLTHGDGPAVCARMNQIFIIAKLTLHLIRLTIEWGEFSAKG